MPARTPVQYRATSATRIFDILSVTRSCRRRGSRTSGRTEFELRGVWRLRAARRVVGVVVQHDCDVYGDCELLRPDQRDPTDPSGRHRRGQGPQAEVGRGGSLSALRLPIEATAIISSMDVGARRQCRSTQGSPAQRGDVRFALPAQPVNATLYPRWKMECIQ